MNDERLDLRRMENGEDVAVRGRTKGKLSVQYPGGLKGFGDPP